MLVCGWLTFSPSLLVFEKNFRVGNPVISYLKEVKATHKLSVASTHRPTYRNVGTHFDAVSL